MKVSNILIKFSNEIFSGELRKGVKVLVWKRCWWKKVSFENTYKNSFWYMSGSISFYTVKQLQLGLSCSAENKCFLMFLFSKGSSRKSLVISSKYIPNSYTKYPTMIVYSHKLQSKWILIKFLQTFSLLSLFLKDRSFIIFTKLLQKLIFHTPDKHMYICVSEGYN